MENKEINSLSPLVWAYLGDAVFELMVRAHLVRQGWQKLEDLHRQTTALVNAGAQADLLQSLHGFLSVDEEDLVRRGRNMKSQVPKNISMGEYRLSTGFEALLGYLYLSGKQERLAEIFAYLLEVRGHEK
ncbi:MAG TPA: ribonuclease III [Clostridia bacterium]|jgi:ribonuclease-3 family protein|nr:ribonuclease III [Clostridia bacterium]